MIIKCRVRTTHRSNVGTRRCVICTLRLATLLSLLSTVLVWQTATAAEGKLALTQKLFGQTPDGQQVTLYELTNAHGLRARVMEYGAIIVSLEVPNREGKLVDVMLGFDELAPYLRGHPLFGSTVGRYANRIADARFTLNGVEYKLTANAGKNHIHGGGNKRFDKVVWQGHPREGDGWVGVRFDHESKDGEEGFPGNLECSVTYALNNDNELQIRYEAATDKPTIINLTNHSYFNLAGAGNGDVLGHEITINAGFYTPAGEGLIPTGEIHTVKGTPLDFTEPKTIGSRIGELTQTRGYDHCYVLAGSPGSMHPVATVYEPTGGIVMEVRTTEPGVQFYTANGMKDIQGKGGKVYHNHYGFCLETQHFPDSPNKLHFPSTVLRPGQTFQSTTIFKFSTRPSISVIVDPRVELMSIVFRLAGNREYNMGRVPSYAKDVDDHFGRFKDHPAIVRARQLLKQRGISFDAPMKMAVYLTGVESIELRASHSRFPLDQDRRWTENDAETFLRDLRSFVQESNFQTFIEDHQPLYRIARDRLGQVLRDRRISEWLDSFFGCRSRAHLIAVVGMLNGRAFYGPSAQLADGQEEIYSIVGAGACDEAGLPKFDPAIVPTAVHEFCHSYTNPLIDQHLEALKPSGEKIFTLLKTEMSQQAYGDWTTMMRESLVRACVVRYVAAIDGADAAAAEVKRNLDRRFFWTEALARLLAEYETSRQAYPTLDTFMPRIVPFFDKYAAERLEQDMAALREERNRRLEVLEAKSPKIVSITPADGAEDVDPDTPAIVITFDRPMKKGNLAIMTIGVEFPAAAGKNTFDDSGKVLTMPVKLKPQTAYGFGLNGEDFYVMQDEQGNPLASVVVTFKTRAAR